MLKKILDNHFQKISLASLLLVIFCVLFPSLQSGTVSYQDHALIFENPLVHSLSQDSLRGFFTSLTSQGYVPLTQAAQAMEYAVFGNTASGYHWVNLILHGLIVLGVYFFSLRMGLNVFGATMASLLFGVHPLHIQHAGWISSQGDLWCAFFYVWSLILYQDFLDSFPVEKVNKKTSKNSEGPRTGNPGILWGAIFLAGLSSISAYWGTSAFCVFLLMDWRQGRSGVGKMVQEKVWLIFLSGVLTLLYALSAPTPLGSVFKENLFTFPVRSVFYAREFFLPLSQSPFYPVRTAIGLSDPFFLASFLLLGIVLWGVFRNKQKKWFVFPVVFYFLSAWFFCDSHSGVRWYLNSGFFYFPTLGFCILFGYCLEHLVRRPAEKKSLGMSIFRYAAISLFFVGLVASIRVSFHVAQLWKHERNVWQSQWEKYPEDFFAFDQWMKILRADTQYRQAIVQLRKKIGAQGQGVQPQGLQFQEVADPEGRVRELMGFYQRAVRMNPERPEALCGLADLYLQIGLFPKAQDLYIQAIEKFPLHEDAYFGLAEVYKQKGEMANAVKVLDIVVTADKINMDVCYSAMEFCTEVLALDPANDLCQSARARYFERYVKLSNQRVLDSREYLRLGKVFSDMGDFERANAAYRKVVDRDANHVDALYGLGNLYRKYGGLEESAKFYQKVIALNPNRGDVYKSLASVYGLQGQADKAIEYYEKALAFNPEDGKAHFDLAYIFENKGNLRKAINAYEEALKYLPEDDRIYYNLGNIYAKLEIREKAADLYEMAISLNPRYLDAYVNLSIVMFQLQKYSEAIKYCDLAVILGYEPPAAYLQALELHRVKE